MTIVSTLLIPMIRVVHVARSAISPVAGATTQAEPPDTPRLLR
jgi:hypothetical protein